MNDLSDVFAEGLTVLEGVDGLEHLDVQLDLIIGDAIGTDPQEHGDDDVEVVVEDRDVEFPNCVNCLD